MTTSHFGGSPRLLRALPQVRCFHVMAMFTNPDAWHRFNLRWRSRSRAAECRSRLTRVDAIGDARMSTRSSRCSTKPTGR